MQKMIMTIGMSILWTLSLQADSVNLVTDASFESPVPLGVPRGSDFFVDKVATSAHDGTHALTFKCWSASPSAVVLKPTLVIPTDSASFTVWVRRRTQPTSQIVTVKFGLYDEPGTTKLMSLATTATTGINAWTQVQVTNLPVGTNVKNQNVRLGFTVTGPSAGCEVDVDQAGVWGSSTVPPGGVVNNAEFHVMEAENLSNGTGWNAVAHNAEYAYNEPSGSGSLQILGGASPICISDAQATVTWNLTVNNSGVYNFWFRFLTGGYYGGFWFEVYQGGSKVASTDNISDNDTTQYGPAWNYAWSSFPVTLQAGAVEIRLKRPWNTASWVTRRVDALCLTNDLSYAPNHMDFLPPAYMRFTNTASGGTPYCLWGFGYNLRSPYWNLPGMISQAGENQGYYVPANQAIWIGPGQSSPWIRFNSYLRLATWASQFEFIASRNSHVDGYVTDPWLGQFDFATGDNHTIVKTISVNQTGPRVLMTLQGDIASYPDQIRSSWDYLNQSRATVDANPQAAHPPITHLNVCTILNLDVEDDDYALFSGEINVLKDMGMNNLYTNGPTLDKAGFGLLATSGYGVGGYYTIDSCFNQPNWTTINSYIASAASLWAGKTASVTLSKSGDEYAPNTLDHVVGCSVCTDMFPAYLQGKGLSLSDLGIGSWTQAVPKGNADKDTYPALYYYTHLFRMDSFREINRQLQDNVTVQFPNARTYNNVSPALGEQTWMTYGGGNDLYMTIRNGMGMGWSEDWIGYGAGPTQSSYLLSMLRVACRPENKSYGMYMVAQNGPAEVLRTKLYEALAGGARDLCLYSYGPAYALSADTWSSMTDRYPYIMETLAEFGKIDGDLYGTVRHPADIAVLYNRTAGIREFSGSENSWEMDMQFTYWALVHAGYMVDVIPEEDIETGALNNYKVLYINGECIRQTTADNISAWMNGGSGRVLVGTAGAGSKNEYNQPISTLKTLFGLDANSLTKSQVAGRPRYEIRNLNTLSTITVTLPSKTVVFDQLAWQEILTTSIGTILGHDASNNVVAVQKTTGGNTALRFGFLPGLTYIHEAWTQLVHNGYTPIGYPENLRDLIAYGATLAEARKVVQSSRSDLPIECSRYDAPDGSRSVIFIINHNYDPVALTLTIPDAANVTTVSSARQGPMSFQRQGDSIILTLNLDRNTDALILQNIPGDFNGDGQVDGSDLTILLAKMDTVNGEAGYDAVCDLDHDGEITSSDLSALLISIMPP